MCSLLLNRITAVASDNSLLYTWRVVVGLRISVSRGCLCEPCKKMAEPIEMPFRGLTQMGPSNYVVGRGNVWPTEKHWEPLLWCTQKWLNQSRCGLRGWLVWAKGSSPNHVLEGSSSDESIRRREGWQDDSVAFHKLFQLLVIVYYHCYHCYYYPAMVSAIRLRRD